LHSDTSLVIRTNAWICGGAAQFVVAILYGRILIDCITTSTFTLSMGEMLGNLNSAITPGVFVAAGPIEGSASIVTTMQ
jgi:hypothetical protein